MKKKIIAILYIAVIICTLISGCGSKNEPAEPETEVAVDLEDGVYTADFDTDSSMFHINEACEGKGTLTVESGKAVIHISLVSKNIENLFLGLEIGRAHV